MSRDERQKKINNITLVGSGINIGLAILKGIFGFLIGSVGLVADAFHSLSDLATDIVVLIGTKLGARPADKNHPFGHGKLETFSTMIVALVLISVGVLLVLEGYKRLSIPHEAQNGQWFILAVAGFSVLMKEWLYQRTMTISRITHSTALVANAWHHRSDALSSVAVMLGAVTMALGWPYGDQSAGIIVGLMVSYAGLKILYNVVNELGESAVDDKTRQRIEDILAEQKEVHSYHRLRTRRSGHVVMMDIHILVDPAISLIQGHNISKRLEHALHRRLDFPVNITVHVEPDIPSEKNNPN